MTKNNNKELHVIICLLFIFSYPNVSVLAIDFSLSIYKLEIPSLNLEVSVKSKSKSANDFLCHRCNYVCVHEGGHLMPLIEFPASARNKG